MTFLNPAVLFGLLAATIPVLLHFLNLRKLRKIEFSTLSFLKELQKTKIRRIKFKQWLLMLIRIAIIILLVAAFARPAIKNISFGASSSAKTTAVIIIDNTFSMSAVTEKGSFLNRAKQTAKNLLNNFQEGDEIAVIPIADLSGGKFEPVTNFKDVLNSINDISLSAVSGTFNNAIVAASKILYASKNFNKEIYLISDFQKGRINNSSADISDLSKSLTEKTRLFLIDVRSKEITNLGIEDLIPENQIFETGKNIVFSSRVKNYSQQAVNNSVVSLYLNGKRCAQQSLNLSGGEIKKISFETTLSDTGFIDVSAELEDDDIPMDNKRFAEIYVPGRISLLIIRDNAEDLKFIKLIAAGTEQKITINEIPLAQIASANLKGYNAIFIIASDNNPDLKILTEFVDAGGRIVVMPGSGCSLQNFQKICAALKVSAPLNQAGEINSSSNPFRFGKTDFENPLFQNLFENQNQKQIESPLIYFYFRIIPEPPGKNIIAMTDNSSFLSEYKLGKGKIFLFNSAPSLSWSNFPVKGIFAPLINKLIHYSASNTSGQNDFKAGDEIIADISSGSAGQIIVRRPDGINEYINRDSLQNKNYLAYKKTDETGIYKFYSGEKPVAGIAVNYDSKESSTEKMTMDELDKYLSETGFGGKTYSVSPDDDFNKIIYQSRFGAELWKYFLIAVLLLALIESIVARNTKNELASINN